MEGFTKVRIPDKIRNSLLHVQFQSSAQSPISPGHLPTLAMYQGPLENVTYLQILKNISTCYKIRP